MSLKLVVGFLLACFVCAANANQLGLLTYKNETSLMNKLLGQWQITDSSLGANGQWQAGPGASWHFYTILNGHAVQDDWISPPLSKQAPPTGRQYGTNIRIYNPQKTQWEMAWASVKGQKIDTFVATESADEMVMTGVFNGQQSRITFYAIKANSFAWKLAVQQADESWLEVYRIKADRQQP